MVAGLTNSTRDHWLTRGIPVAIVDRMVAFEAQWGGLVLPPAPLYEGGPKMFRRDMEDVSEGYAGDDLVGRVVVRRGRPALLHGYGFRVGSRWPVRDRRRPPASDTARVSRRLGRVPRPSTSGQLLGAPDHQGPRQRR